METDSTGTPAAAPTPEKPVPVIVRWWRSYWYEDAVFRSVNAKGLAGASALLGFLIEKGIVPTGIDGGAAWGPVFYVLAFLLGSGSPLRTAVKNGSGHTPSPAS